LNRYDDSSSDEEEESSSRKGKKKLGKDHKKESGTKLKVIKTLQFQRLKNLNVNESDKKMNELADIIYSIDFHPTQPMALVADSKDRVAMYKVHT